MSFHVAKNGKAEPEGWYYYTGCYTINGVTRRVGVGAHPSPTDATNALVRKLADLGISTEGGSARDVGMSIGRWVEVYLQGRSDLDRKTLAMHTLACNEFVAHVGKSTLLKNVGRQHARDWGLVLRKKTSGGKHLKTETIRSIFSRLRACFQWAIDRDPPLIERNPFAGGVLKDVGLGIRNKRYADWKYVPLAEFDKVVAEVGNEQVAAMMMLARHAGLRSSETLFLRWGDINWKERCLTVRVRNEQGRNTTKQHERMVPISPALYDFLLQAYHDVGKKSVGPCHPHPKKPEKHIHKAREAAGVEDWGKPLHTLRKCLGTDWLDIPNLPPERAAQWFGDTVEVMRLFYYERFPVRSLHIVTKVDSSAMAAVTNQQTNSLSQEFARHGLTESQENNHHNILTDRENQVQYFHATSQIQPDRFSLPVGGTDLPVEQFIRP